MTTITTPYGNHASLGATAPQRTSRRWALAGVVAGASAVAAVVVNGFIDAAYFDKKQEMVATAVRDRLADQRGILLVFHILTMITVLAVPVFAAGLARRLRTSLSADSLLPGITVIGLALVSVAGLVGAGLDTEWLNGPIDQIAPAESTAFFAHWIGTMPYLWAGAGLAALAVAVAAHKHHAVPRWIGIVSLVLGAVTALFGVSPLQYASGMTGPLWLLVISIGFLLGDKKVQH